MILYSILVGLSLLIIKRIDSNVYTDIIHSIFNDKSSININLLFFGY